MLTNFPRNFCSIVKSAICFKRSMASKIKLPSTWCHEETQECFPLLTNWEMFPALRTHSVHAPCSPANFSQQDDPPQIDLHRQHAKKCSCEHELTCILWYSKIQKQYFKDKKTTDFSLQRTLMSISYVCKFLWWNDIHGGPGKKIDAPKCFQKQSFRSIEFFFWHRPPRMAFHRKHLYGYEKIHQCLLAKNKIFLNFFRYSFGFTASKVHVSTC